MNTSRRAPVHFRSVFGGKNKLYHLYSWYGSEKLTVFCRPPPVKNEQNNKKQNQKKKKQKGAVKFYLCFPWAFGRMNPISSGLFPSGGFP